MKIDLYYYINLYDNALKYMGEVRLNLHHGNIEIKAIESKLYELDNVKIDGIELIYNTNEIYGYTVSSETLDTFDKFAISYNPIHKKPFDQSYHIVIVLNKKQLNDLFKLIHVNDSNSNKFTLLELKNLDTYTYEQLKFIEKILDGQMYRYNAIAPKRIFCAELFGYKNNV